MDRQLPPLPEPGLTSYSLDSVMRKYEHQSYTADQLRSYAEEAVKLEREACAKLCDEQADAHSDRQFLNTQAAIGCDGCAAAIRARGDSNG